ncbi:MAG: putative toxin-antitoxin system toxin component, PIN family [Paludibacteraceae bacterium]|nr:putative toxin-antitoxin system toxin component, PIN family [Paludibacteraceae bacterium]
MPTNKIRVIIDTNIWISSLIGRQLVTLRELLSYPSIELVITEQLLQEILLVAQRPKFSKYFRSEDIEQLRLWIEHNMVNIPLGRIPARCRDPKDDYLLELAIQAKAIYLVSGDNDLLELGSIEGCQIMTVQQFEKEIISKLNKYNS